MHQASTQEGFDDGPLPGQLREPGVHVELGLVCLLW